jgi:hypothetical protein
MVPIPERDPRVYLAAERIVPGLNSHWSGTNGRGLCGGSVWTIFKANDNVGNAYCCPPQQVFRYGLA